MAFRVALTRRACRSLTDDLPERVAAACWEFVRGPLREGPDLVGTPLLEELAGRWSVRRGEYRVIYEIRGDLVLVRVVDLLHRRDV